MNYSLNPSAWVMSPVLIFGICVLIYIGFAG